MKPFRWAVAIATLFAVHGWLAESHEDLASWAGPSHTIDALVAVARGLLVGPSAVAVGLFARVQDRDVLENPNRGRIHAFVRANPGASLSEIAASAGLGWGTTVHHLERLEAARVLRSYQDGRRRAFLAEGTMSTMGHALLRRTDPTRARLLDAVRISPGASQAELASRAGLSLSAANRHLQLLERVGLVSSRKTWRTRTYLLTDHGSSQTSPLEKRHCDTLSGVSPRGTSTQ
jgi:predicted transcriptional regulator